MKEYLEKKVNEIVKGSFKIDDVEDRDQHVLVIRDFTLRDYKALVGHKGCNARKLRRYMYDWGQENGMKVTVYVINPFKTLKK